MLRTLRSLSLALAAASLLAPAAANASTRHAKAKKASSTYPTVTRITPRRVAIGDRLTVTGTSFRAGKGKTTVVFLAKGSPAIFVKADSATTKKLVVTIPTKLANYLAQRSGAPVPTQFRIRILARKFSRSWTQNSRSPQVLPLPFTTTGPGSSTAPTAPAAAPTCQQQAAANPTGDNDHDGVTNAIEIQYGMDPCNPDSDGDGVSDGYEYYAAIDLNGSARPYPGSAPWPNPLDPSDVNYDFDGDGLLMWQEYRLWKASSGTFPLTAYSDGTQNSGGTQPVTTLAQAYLDLDGDGNLTDDERDADGDGLSNIVEYNYTGTQKWWKNVAWTYKPHTTDPPPYHYIEAPYALRTFSDLDPTKADSDGDGIPDGADDQDNDGWSNFVEMQLGRSRSGYRVNPFNPCLPDPHAATCGRWVPMDGSPWPPFDKTDTTNTSQESGDAYPFAWPNIDYATWVGASRPVPLDLAHQYQGPWDPAGWFTGAWNGTTGPQGP